MSDVIERVVGTITQANELLVAYETQLNDVTADKKLAAGLVDKIVGQLSQQKLGSQFVIAEEDVSRARDEMNTHAGLADLFAKYVEVVSPYLQPPTEPKIASDLGRPATDRSGQMAFDPAKVRSFADLPPTRAVQF